MAASCRGPPARAAYSSFDSASRELLRSETGPSDLCALTAFPTAPEFRLSSSCFRVLSRRRLRLLGQMLGHQARTRRCDRSQAHGLGVPQASQPRRRSRPLARAQQHCGDQVLHGAKTSWRAWPQTGAGGRHRPEQCEAARRSEAAPNVAVGGEGSKKN